MHSTRSTALLAMIVLFSPLAVYSGETPKLQMWEEPSHQLVFTKENIRVLDVRIVPGVTSGYHEHQYATTYIVIEDAHLKNQLWDTDWSEASTQAYRDSGTVVNRAMYVSKPSYHRVENVDDRTLHLVAVVNTQQHEYKLSDSNVGESGQFDNQWFKMHRVQLGPRERSDSLKFSNNVVLVQFTDEPSHIIEKDIAHSFKTMPGAFSWHSAGSEFQIKNQSEREQEFILLEVK